MSGISTKSLHASQLLPAIAMITLAIAFNTDVHAQAKSGNSVGAPTGAVGGGATGASNRGGAGGVSNPSPGGSPGTAGEPGQSSGPRTTETARPGYLGGRTTDVVNPPVNPPPGTTISSITVTQFGKCPVPGGVLSHEARISGSNIGRIETIARYLARGPKKDGAANTTYLLADLQEELQKAKPDLTLAGTYLGIVAKSAITPQLTMDIGESLCAPMSPNAAEQIATIAEAQRRKLAKER